jgi:hypothetical protein
MSRPSPAYQVPRIVEAVVGDMQEVAAVASVVVAVDIGVAGECLPFGMGYTMLEEAVPGRLAVMTLYSALQAPLAISEAP